MSKTYIATPPGATIKEQIEDRGMSQRELSIRMDYSEKFISQLINGHVELTPNTALRLESVLGIPASFWLNLESTYREKLQKIEDENSFGVDMELASKFPYAEMAKLGWVAATRILSEKVIELRKYFEVARLNLVAESRLVPNIAYRRQKKTDKSVYALMAWAQKAKLDAREIKTAKINIDKLSKSLGTIRSMTKEDPSVFQDELVDLLASCGIVLVLLPHLKGSFLQGATFYDGPKIVLGLTLRRRDADIFWFSLFHELGHIVCGHIGQENGTSKEDEKQADCFASDMLIPPGIYAQIVSEKQTATSILYWAEELDVAPGIIVGRLQKEGYLQYNQYNNLKVQYEFVT